MSSTGGEPFETATFSFDSGAIGKVNTIQITVQHADPTQSGVNCSSGNPVTYTICIPKIAATRLAGDTTINTFEKYQFKDSIFIDGCDDFNQIEWVQMLTEYAVFVDYTGTLNTVANFGSGTIDWPGNGPSNPPKPSGWAVPGGAGWTMSISGYKATLSPYDIHEWDFSSFTGSFQIGGTGTFYNYCVSASDALTFEDKIRRKADRADLGKFEWSYTWDNHIAWPTSPSVPTLTQYNTATSNESGIYGGPAGSGTAGHFTNVINMTLP